MAEHIRELVPQGATIVGGAVIALFAFDLCLLGYGAFIRSKSNLHTMQRDRGGL